MLRRRLGATVSAMILAVQLGGIAAAAEPTVDQLVEIREYLAENDIGALRSYLEQYPDLLDGDSQLAILLRKFLLKSKHLPNYLLSDDPTQEPSGAANDGEGSDPDGNAIY